MRRLLFILTIVLLGTACKKAFVPSGALADQNKYLVIDGVINSGSDSTFIKLSRTKKFDTTIVVNVETGAKLAIESDASASYSLTEIAPGTYAAPPMSLDPLHKYRLDIKTSDGKQYLSDYVAVKNAPPIDSVGFKALNDGVHIYVNAHDDANATRYYRWGYTEAWEFHSWFHSFWVGLRPRYANESVYICYTGDTSKSIVTSSTATLVKDMIYQAPVATIPATSEKIEAKYSILVKQYALTSDAYSFWQNLSKNTNQFGSIFDPQPSTNQTNYHCVENPNELVVGYLSVGTVTTKRIFITADQLLKSYAPADNFGCKLDSAYYYHQPFYFDLPPQSTTIDGFYVAPLAPLGGPNYITYSTTVCADCTVRGKVTPPPFWQ
jgi:hypothetical protein